MSRKKVVREVMDEFRKLVQILRSSHRAAANINVTAAQLFVMTILAESDKVLSVSAVAERTQTDPSTVSVVVTRLVDRGLVRRQPAETDSRRIDLSLTAKGRLLLRRAPVTVAQQRLADALGSLSDREVGALRKTLGRLLAGMGAEAGPAGMMFDDGDSRS